MTNLEINRGGLIGLFNHLETPEQTLAIDKRILAETGNDTFFASLAYANLVVFTALLFSLAGLDPYYSTAYGFFAFGILVSTSITNFLLERQRSQKFTGILLIVCFAVNELALASILVFDYLAPARADGFVAIVTVASISFLSVPVFARFLKSFLAIKLLVIALCCIYTITTPSYKYGTSIALAALAIAYLLIAAIGYWIVKSRRSEVLLRLELERMNLANELAHQKAKENVELRQRLITYIGHDLRQPISAAGFVLHRLYETKPEDATLQSIEDMKECIQSAGRMIEDIVQISHYNNPDIEVLSEVTDLNDILLRLARDYQLDARNSGIILNVVETSIYIDFDPDLLMRILRNLTRNAIEHSTAKKILIGVRRRKGGVAIWVIDNGRGLKLSQHKEHSSGLGLGLEISSQLASACGAKLEIHSEPEFGTCCQLNIPDRLIIRK